jgi:hypothetical protein
MFDLEALPERMDRKAAAAFISRHFFPVAARSLERWPLNESAPNRRLRGSGGADAAARRRSASATNWRVFSLTRPFT